MILKIINLNLGLCFPGANGLTQEHICTKTQVCHVLLAHTNGLTHWGRMRKMDDIFKCIFLNENVWILIKNSLKFVPKVRINKIPALVQIMAWRRPEPMVVSLPTHICVIRPQWVNNANIFVMTLFDPPIVPCPGFLSNSLATRGCYCKFHSVILKRTSVINVLSITCKMANKFHGSQHWFRLHA